MTSKVCIIFKIALPRTRTPSLSQPQHQLRKKTVSTRNIELILYLHKSHLFEVPRSIRMEKPAASSKYSTHGSEKQPPPYTPTSFMSSGFNDSSPTTSKSANLFKRLFERCGKERKPESVARVSSSATISYQPQISIKSKQVEAKLVEVMSKSSPISAASIPQWDWTTLECQHFIQSVLCTHLGHTFPAAQMTAMKFKGRGENLFKKHEWDWYRILESDEDADSMYALIYYQREEEGAVPLDRLRDFGKVLRWTMKENCKIFSKGRREMEERIKTCEELNLQRGELNWRDAEATKLKREKAAKEEVKRRITFEQPLAEVNDLESEVESLKGSVNELLMRQHREEDNRVSEASEASEGNEISQQGGSQAFCGLCEWRSYNSKLLGMDV